MSGYSGYMSGYSGDHWDFWFCLENRYHQFLNPMPSDFHRTVCFLKIVFLWLLSWLFLSHFLSFVILHPKVAQCFLMKWLVASNSNKYKFSYLRARIVYLSQMLVQYRSTSNTWGLTTGEIGTYHWVSIG